MSKRPLRSSGTLEKTSEGWSVRLADIHPSFTDAMPIDVILWDSRPVGQKNEVEEIARIQQLEPEVVALALSAEGMLRSTDFAQRVG